jgi:hypothetical protein
MDDADYIAVLVGHFYARGTPFPFSIHEKFARHPLRRGDCHCLARQLLGYSREAQVFLAKVEMKAWHMQSRREHLGDRPQTLSLQLLVLFRSSSPR